MGRAQDVGVILAEDAAGAGKGVGVEVVGLLVLPQSAQIAGEVTR